MTWDFRNRPAAGRRARNTFQALAVIDDQVFSDVNFIKHTYNDGYDYMKTVLKHKIYILRLMKEVAKSSNLPSSQAYN